MQQWQNFAHGALSQEASSSALVLHSATFAALQEVVAPATLTLVLDPEAGAGVPEVVVVTAHTLGAQTATVARGAQSTSSRVHAAGTEWVAPVTAADMDRITAIEAPGWVTALRMALNSVPASAIQRGAVGELALAAAAVPSRALQVGCVLARNIGAGQVGQAALASGAVVADKLGPGCVSASKIATVSGVPEVHVGTTVVEGVGKRRPRTTISATAPASPQDGDIWLQPASS